MALIRIGNQITREDFAPADPYQLMVEQFAAVLHAETRIWYTPQEALQTLHVLDAIRARW